MGILFHSLLILRAVVVSSFAHTEGPIQRALGDADATGCSFGDMRDAFVEVELPLAAVQAPPPGQQRWIICSTAAPFSADISTSIRSDLLIHKLQRKLHLARSLRLKDMVERWRADVAIGQSEVRAVQDVKQLSAELELL